MAEIVGHRKNSAIYKPTLYMKKDIKLGGVICLYQILKAAASEITEEASTVIIDELFMSLADYANQEQIYIVACLEVIGLLGPC